MHSFIVIYTLHDGIYFTIKININYTYSCCIYFICFFFSSSYLLYFAGYSQYNNYPFSVCIVLHGVQTQQFKKIYIISLCVYLCMCYARVFVPRRVWYNVNFTRGHKSRRLRLASTFALGRSSSRPCSDSEQPKMSDKDQTTRFYFHTIISTIW